MKLTVKTVSGSEYNVEAEMEETAATVRQRIVASDTALAEMNTKLVYVGRVLADNVTMGDAGVQDGDYLVLMVSAKKKPTAPEPTAAVAPPAPVANPPPTSATTPSNPAPAPPTTTTTTTSSGPTVDEGVVASLCEMGFPREQVVAALAAAFNNADRAVEYLFGGIPADAAAAVSNPPAATAAPAPVPATAPPPPATAAPQPAATVFTADSIAQALHSPPPTPFERMQREPQLLHLAAMARQNPSLLQPLLQELSVSSPHLLALINSDQTAFQQLLNAPTIPTPTTHTQQPLAIPPPSSTPAPQQPSAATGQADGTVHVQLNSEEMAAVQRLEQLGFERDAAVQAYMACDKDETLAANLLFDGGI